MRRCARGGTHRRGRWPEQVPSRDLLEGHSEDGMHGQWDCPRDPFLRRSVDDLRRQHSEDKPESLSILPLSRQRRDRHGEKQDDREPSLEGRQVPHGYRHRRYRREKQEESDNAVLDQNRQGHTVGSPSKEERRLDGRSVGAGTHAGYGMLLRHLQARLPNGTTATEMARADVGSDGLKAFQ